MYIRKKLRELGTSDLSAAPNTHSATFLERRVASKNFATPTCNNHAVVATRSPGEPQTGSGLDWTDLLLAHPAVSSQYILEISDGIRECRCHNTDDLEGFESCDQQGRIVEPVLGHWDGSLQICTRCWRIINGDTLEVLGMTSEAIVDANEQYRWGAAI